MVAISAGARKESPKLPEGASLSGRLSTPLRMKATHPSGEKVMRRDLSDLLAFNVNRRSLLD